MPNTTNFNWATPADTDLVKDGAAAIRTLGNSIDSSFVDLKGGTTGQVLTKASNTDLDFSFTTPTDQTPLTTKGDLFGFDTADARIPIGTNGHILTADSTQSLGLKWAAPAGGMTFISRTALSSAASLAFDDIFTSAYNTYFVTIEDWIGVTAADDPQIQFRYAGPTTQTSDYYSSSQGSSNGGGSSVVAVANGSQVTLWNNIGLSPGTFVQMYVSNVGNASERPTVTGIGIDSYSQERYAFGGGPNTARTYTGLLLKTSSGDCSATVTVYGLAKA